jgi:hypothetical protein
MGGSFNFIVKNNSPYVMQIFIDSSNNNCVDDQFCTPSPFLGANVLIQPGQNTSWTVYHKTGHGCDGTQAVFQAQPSFVIGKSTQAGEFQGFQYDNNGGVAFNSSPPNYGSQLSQPGGSGTPATWLITVFG